MFRLPASFSQERPGGALHRKCGHEAVRNRVAATDLSARVAKFENTIGGPMDHEDVLRQAAAKYGLTSLAPIAQGGQKLVARAVQGSADVVVKVVLIAGAPDPHALERCEREVALLKSLSHPNVVRVLSELEVLGSPAEATYWVEEYLEGDDLTALVGPQWAWDDAEKMMYEVASGLAAMHQLNCVHRDLSARNVRRTSSDQWKILDPGLAKHLDRSSITGLFTPGTPGFMSPEQATAGVRVTPASDVYSLGILAFLALTGDVPIPVGASFADYRTRLLYTDPPSLGAVRGDLDANQAALVDGCIARQPGRRWIDADELLSELVDLREN
ncbi:serine/threonine-protein kinase [uncultured Serinicoccus sp.]|uniref:serine/threonine-protein kinase n=1 Tax=uncultured Serinicoccus sp. TaxID=735514 RepID=UPI0026241931|nr:serine/threonine-protein kinase [uncultured Serinicoccus sp.]